MSYSVAGLRAIRHERGRDVAACIDLHTCLLTELLQDDMLLGLDEFECSGEARLRVLLQRLLLYSIDGDFDRVCRLTVGASGHPSALIAHLCRWI